MTISPLYQQMAQLQSMGGSQQLQPFPGYGGAPAPGTPNAGDLNASDLMKMMFLQKAMQAGRTGNGDKWDRFREGISSAAPLLMMAYKDYQAGRGKKAGTPMMDEPDKPGMPDENDSYLNNGSAPIPSDMANSRAGDLLSKLALMTNGGMG